MDSSGNALINKWITALAAAGCFGASAVLFLRAEDQPFWWGGFLRAGVVLVILWFCPPSKGRPAAWAGIQPLNAALFAAAVLITLIRPKVGIPLLIVLIVAFKLAALLRGKR